MKKVKQEKGITLVALIITIVVLLILAAVTINSIQNDGIINKAQNVAEKFNKAQENEAELLDSYLSYLDTAIGSSGEEDSSAETIPTTTSYVGYYANLDDDAEPEGIIYADLAIGGSGQWNSSYDAYSYSAITGTKDYYISTESYNGAFGAKPVLTATGSGEDRFYVMALEDFSTESYSTFYWYYNAFSNKISDYSTITSTEFGTGKSNTSAMITAWKAQTYGDQNARDMWGVIQDKVTEGWFVPSKGEWVAFGNNLGITSSNHSSYGLSDYCWSSSLCSTYSAWTAFLCDGIVSEYTINSPTYVRLSATF